MKWKTFFQIVLLLIITGIIFYILYPKYEFFRIDKGDKIIYFRQNKFNGLVEWTDNDVICWKRLAYTQSCKIYKRLLEGK